MSKWTSLLILSGAQRLGFSGTSLVTCEISPKTYKICIVKSDVTNDVGPFFETSAMTWKCHVSTRIVSRVFFRQGGCRLAEVLAARSELMWHVLYSGSNDNRWLKRECSHIAEAVLPIFLKIKKGHCLACMHFFVYFSIGNFF